MKNFDPTKLAPPTAVNPKTATAIVWQIRVNRDSNKVSVQGLIKEFDLENNGVTYSFDNPLNPTALIMYPRPKDEAKTIKGTSAEAKMTSFVMMLETLGLVEKNEQIAYYRAEPIEGHDGYYNIVRDPNNESVLYPEAEADSEEPSDEEIADSVEAEA